MYLSKIVTNKDYNIKTEKIKQLMKTEKGKKIIEKINNQKNNQKNITSENGNGDNNAVEEENNNSDNVEKYKESNNGNSNVNSNESKIKAIFKDIKLNNNLYNQFKRLASLQEKDIDRSAKKKFYPKLVLNDSSVDEDEDEYKNDEDDKEKKEEIKEKEKNAKEKEEYLKSKGFDSDKSDTSNSRDISKKSSKKINTKNSVKSSNKNVVENEHETKDPFTDLKYLRELLKNDDDDRKKRIKDLFKNDPKNDKEKNKEKNEGEQQGNSGFTKNGFYVRRKKRYRTVIKSDFLI